VYHILLPILIDGSTTSPNMSRGTKSSYLQSSKTGDYPFDPEKSQATFLRSGRGL
jgi:hypothetical protein